MAIDFDESETMDKVERYGLNRWASFDQADASTWLPSVESRLGNSTVSSNINWYKSTKNAMVSGMLG